MAESEQQDELAVLMIFKSTYEQLVEIAVKRKKTVAWVLSDALSKYILAEQDRS